MATTAKLGYDDLPALLVRMTGDEKHDWSSLSTLDVIWTLYDRVLREEDRFLLSKGHGPTAFYAVLAAKGILPLEALDDFAAFESPLGHHPDRNLVPGVEISSGSLGHGLPIAVGVALAGRRTFCLVGDGELDEGSNWEAVQYAGRIGLENLTAIVIDNRSATYGWPGGIAARFELEAWSIDVVNGRDHDAIEAGLGRRTSRPHVVVAEVHA
jgi:transketolase